MSTRDHGPLELVLRHEHGRIVASLMREFGAHRLAIVEDAIGQALLEGTTAWRTRGVPPHARAWIHRAARHRVIDELRRRHREEGLDGAPEPAVAADDGEAALAGDVHDDELRALFACAEPSIPLASQIVFALRGLCGFSTREIAMRLVTSEANVQKRFERARDRLREVDLQRVPDASEWPDRADAVLRMIYVLFTEGYFASSGDRVLRLELCREALRLAELVVAHPRASSSNALALLALMRLHHARRDARVDAEGEPVAIEEQDRRRYHRRELVEALDALQTATRGGLASKYHIEAAIAAEHAFAPNFEATRWATIHGLYQRLVQLEPSPLHELHAAIALSYAEGPEAGLAHLEKTRPPTWLRESHLWLATYADLHRRLGDLDRAREYYDRALAIAPENERRMLSRRRAALA
ncbi:MAG: tetratricopeptide repeat protein [Deltaproteobacteria bacterium]|nr:tetratricopeptide repeat protein [Deltaproteobacteria bacterium]